MEGNGFKIKSWADLRSLLLLVIFILSGIVWGMKLEYRYDTLNEDMKEFKDERMEEFERRIQRLEDN